MCTWEYRGVKNILHHAAIISHISVLGLLDGVIMSQQKNKKFFKLGGTILPIFRPSI